MQHTPPPAPISPALTAELRYLHQVMKVLEILAEQPTLCVVAFGKIWRYPDLLSTSLRYAYLAQLHGFDVSPFKQWFDKDCALFAQHGLSWNYG
ncbi:hypothetical protein [Arsukibacterium indicum]|uniref:Uncharacterized protein n=1 Tax=Arsukibacterium indicum TaxID=2848612 RepID=A0ABS6MPJ8_9GAMM|nr:hypothetical protein [Arsukibacterium indicum]MBV2130500.1 hypothetical protein [Arsukibacterium indicum]